MIEAGTLKKQSAQVNLRPGWKLLKLREACSQDRRIVNPASSEAQRLPYLGLEDVESQTGKILRLSNEASETEGKSTTFAFDMRHVLYGKLRPYLNKVALPTAEGRCTTEIIPLLPGESVQREFIAWTLRRQETVDAMMKEKTGSRMPRADMDVLLDTIIPLPPLAEQRRIVSILSKQMEAVERARAAAEARLDAAKALPAAYLRAVFDSPEAQQWPRKRLDQALEMADSGIWGEPDPDNGINILRSTNFRNDGTFDLSDLAMRAIPAEKRDQKVLLPGDIVLERSGGGPKQPVGRVCFFEGDKRDHTFGNFCQRLRARSGICDARFLFWHLYLFHMSGQTQLYQTRTTGIRNLEYKRYLAHQLPLPPLSEQQRIVSILSEQMTSVERARKALQDGLDTISKLPSALLRRAFTGGL